MNTIAHEALPGFAALKAKFMAILAERQADVASHAMDAWNAETADDKIASLTSARAILHKIAGTAGSFGLPEIGAAASTCECMIDDHLDAPGSEGEPCPTEILIAIDEFVSRCEPYLDAA